MAQSDKRWPGSQTAAGGLGALNKGCEGALGLCRTFQVAENAKKPRLAYLAKRMTSAGQTSLTWANDVEEEVETQLMKIRRQRPPSLRTANGAMEHVSSPMTLQGQLSRWTRIVIHMDRSWTPATTRASTGY
jgi:hypothetical protein